MKTLHELVREWKHWAETADCTEEGWQSDFPAWEELMGAAIRTMGRSDLSTCELKDLELCWSISEESEALADYARDHTATTWDALTRLAESDLPGVRWQVYDALSFSGGRAAEILRAALDDPDMYARRRAILGLARTRPTDADSLAMRLEQSDDPYIRSAARELRGA